MSDSIVGHGVDLVEVDRIARMLSEHGDRMLQRIFTAHEQSQCESEPLADRRAARYAARFAAKEAALKALGTGLSDGINWTDIGVVTAPTGAPSLQLTGRAAQVAAARGVVAWQVSLSHTRQHAIASVIAIGSGPGDGADASAQ